MIEPYESKKNPFLDGTQHLYKFPNGYGASVIRNTFSYGGPELSELAVLKWTGDTHDLCYDTEITDDVIGYLADDEIEPLLERIRDL